jgi:hypothetical protein
MADVLFGPTQYTPAEAALISELRVPQVEKVSPISEPEGSCKRGAKPRIWLFAESITLLRFYVLTRLEPRHIEEVIDFSKYITTSFILAATNGYNQEV